MIELPLIVTMLLLWLLVALVLAPLEALGWWAGWFEGDEAANPELEPANKPVEKAHVGGYLVFLTGISGVSGEDYLPEEADLLDRLDAAMDDITVVKDVYPYSVRNQALTGQRVFASFWRFALRMKLSGQPLQRFIGFLINLRNAFQVMVSADRRYGPIYNTGTARLIVQSLLRHGYKRGSGMPITLLAYSGGGQIAVGAAPYLKTMTGAPVTVVSLGGAISGEPGVQALERLHHLYGRKDSVQKLGWILSPSRWHIGSVFLLPRSRWNQARQAGKMDFIYMGDIKHSGRGGYLDTQATLPDGRTYMQYTVEMIAGLVARQSS